MDNVLDFIKILLSSGLDLLSLIVGFVIAIAIAYWKEITKMVMKKASHFKEQEVMKAETYAIDSAQKINEILSDVVSNDTRISNVILCNYHNGASSDANLSYYYFTAISEAFGNRTYPCFDFWKEKSYLNYQPELRYIHQKRSAIINVDDLDDIEMLPKFTNLVQQSNAKLCMLIPISGIDKNIGMLVLLFKEHVEIDDRGDYIYSLSKELEQLALLLDYRKHSKKKSK